jgi:hypothetical protein
MIRMLGALVDAADRADRLTAELAALNHSLGYSQALRPH